MGTEGLTDLQLCVMKALWQIGEGTVSDILAIINQEKVLAPTTVATMLQRLSKQGWVKHRRSGRQFVYRAKVNQRDAAKGVLHRVLSSFFGGKISALTAQLLESEDLGPDELEEMQKLIEEKKG